MASPTPLRPDEEVAGGYISATLGGRAYSLAVLPRAANREWQAGLIKVIASTTANLGPIDSLDTLAQSLAAAADDMLKLVIAYDEAGAKAWNREAVLPEYDWLDTHATDRECYDTLKQVAAASFPFGFDLFTLLPDLRPQLLEALTKGVAVATVALSRSTSGSLPSTAGSPTRSSAA